MPIDLENLNPFDPNIRDVISNMRELGNFEAHIAEALSIAFHRQDIRNIERIFKGFPEIIAMCND